MSVRIRIRIMGAIILFTCLSVILAFLLGVLFVAVNDLETNREFWCILTLTAFGVSVGLSIASIRKYYEKKEYSSTKYELKKKVITIEENNTVKLDTVYTFRRK